MPNNKFDYAQRTWGMGASVISLLVCVPVVRVWGNSYSEAELKVCLEYLSSLCVEEKHTVYLLIYNNVYNYYVHLS